MKKLFIYKVIELNVMELKIYGNYMKNGFIIVKKEWLPWLINSIRGRTPDDFNIDYNPSEIKSSDCELCIYNYIRENDLSYFAIDSEWQDSEKNDTCLRIPYPALNKHLIMAYIEPLLCDLAKYLPKEEQEKLVKPWSCNMTFEEWEQRNNSNKNNNSEVRFVQEIDPKDYFGN